jgi:YVTN family beta-propeller protein
MSRLTFTHRLALLLGVLFLSPVVWAGAPQAYITNLNDGTVSVIDTATNTVTATVFVGTFPNGVAVTPDGAHVYVANIFGNSVSVIDTASNTVTATVLVGPHPFGVAVSPDGAHVYVGNQGDGTVSVITTASNTVTATVHVGVGPTGLAVTPDGARVYVANEGSGTVSVIETAGNTVFATVTVGGGPVGVAVTPDGARVYVGNFLGSTVSVIATASNTVTTVPVGQSPEGVAVTPDGTRVYVANFNGNSVSVIATASNTVAATVTVGVNPAGVAVTPDGAHVYVANQNSNNVAVIATASNTVTATVPVGPVGSMKMPRAFGKFISSSGDTTPPVTSLAAQPGTLKGQKLMTANATLTVSPGGLTIQAKCFNTHGLNVLLSATDDSSGVALINYGSAHFVLGQQPPNPALDQSIASASGTIPFLTTGVFVLNYGAVDRAGNQEATRSALVMVNSFEGFACATQPFALAALPSSATVTVSGTLTNGSKTRPFRFKFRYGPRSAERGDDHNNNDTHDD